LVPPRSSSITLVVGELGIDRCPPALFETTTDLVVINVVADSVRYSGEGAGDPTAHDCDVTSMIGSKGCQWS
jgi:hypothetical protein